MLNEFLCNFTDCPNVIETTTILLVISAALQSFQEFLLTAFSI